MSSLLHKIFTWHNLVAIVVNKKNYFNELRIIKNNYCNTDLISQKPDNSTKKNS